MKKAAINMLIIMTCLMLLFTGCINQSKVNKEGDSNKGNEDIIQKVITNPNYVEYVNEKIIRTDTSTLGKEASKYYSKYIEYIAQNSKPIRILAQDKITDEQLMYAYSILEFYITNLEKNGYTGVADELASNNAMLVMPNGADGDGSTPDDAIISQPQYQDETANVGSEWYINNDYSHRDSTFEEIFHLVHGSGIGMVKSPKAAPELAESINDAMRNALPKDKKEWGKEGLWGINAKESLEEWNSEEGSLEAEYIICVIDTYYGLWEAFDGNGALFDEYMCKSRNELIENDPKGLAVLESMLPEYITAMMRIDPSFKGDFVMSLDETISYTYKSQYLINVMLTGNNDTNIVGNDQDNIFVGNKGNNKIDGKDGENIVQFFGESSEYNIIKTEQGCVVKDTVAGRDGEDELINIAVLRFTDTDVLMDNLTDFISQQNANSSSEMTLKEEISKDLDGYKIVFSSPNGRKDYSIYMCNVDGSGEKLLSDKEAGIDMYPEWSGDGKYVYYTSNKHGGTMELYRTNTTGTPTPVQLSLFDREVRSLSVSMDNKYIALGLMTSNVAFGKPLKDYSADLYILETSVLEKRLAENKLVTVNDLQLLKSNPQNEHIWYEQPDFMKTTDGDIPVLAYVRTENYDIDSIMTDTIYTTKIDGSEETLIAEDSSMPRWTNDDKGIVTHEFKVVDVNTKEFESIKIDDLREDAGAASISPDGKYILFETSDKFDRQAGLARVIYTEQSIANPIVILLEMGACEPRWSPVKIED